MSYGKLPFEMSVSKYADIMIPGHASSAPRYRGISIDGQNDHWTVTVTHS